MELKKLKMKNSFVCISLLLLLLPEQFAYGTACNKGEVDNLVKNTQETCSRIKGVDSYITHINRLNAIPVPSTSGRHGFKDILTHYNNDLTKAKNNVKSWRSGENVVGSVKDITVAAQQFEPKFTQEFEKNQARVKLLSEKHENIGKIEAEIASLNVEIEEAKKLVNQTAIPVVVAHLQSVIKTKQEELDRTVRDNQVIQAQKELVELIKYLEIVKNDAGVIKGKAQTARTKITNFKNKVIQDSGAFKRHGTTAQGGITRLRQERDSNNREIANTQTQINNLNKKITDERAEIASLNGEIARAQRELKEIEARIARSQRKVKKKKKWGRIFRIVPVVGWIGGTILINQAKKKERDLANQKRAFISEHGKRVQNLQSQIASSNRDITEFQKRIANHRTRSQELERELQHFSNLDGNIKSVEKEATSILNSITVAINGMAEMESTFSGVQQNLDDVITRAKESKTAAEVRDITYFIYNEINVLKCKWDRAREKIVPVDQCN